MSGFSASPPPPPPPTPAVSKAKRNINVPLKYRCKACNKIYLGDKKMSRHMKSHGPEHGPMAPPELPPPSPLAVATSSSTTASSGPTATAAAAAAASKAGGKLAAAAAAVAAAAAATGQVPTSLSTMPIIPMARTQLEELVKNLDAELVLDVVSKKMFDNFSMWDLQMKKASKSSDKGLKVLDNLFEDTEKV